MTRKHNLRPREFLAFTQAGRFCWRLLVLPFFGALLDFISFVFSANTIDGDWHLPFSYPAIFYAIFLLALWWIGSSLGDQLFGSQVIDLMLLWPLPKRTKQGWLYFRSTWLPGILLLLGAIPASHLVHGEHAARMLLSSLPYGLAATFLLSVLLWKGSYMVVDVGTFLGKVSIREETRLSVLIFFLSLSPLVAIDMFLYPLRLVASALLVILATVYILSDKEELQVGGETGHPSAATATSKPRELPFLPSARGPLYRYLYFLEWDALKHPLRTLLLNGFTAVFIVMVYYFLGGMFSSNREAPLHYRSLYLSLMVCLATFLLHDAARTMLPHKQDMLLPLSPGKKAVAGILHQVLRPSALAFPNTGVAVVAIALAHHGLAWVTPQPHPPYGQLLLQTLRFNLIFLPLTFAVLSSLDLVLKALIFAVQRFKLYKVASWLLREGSFYLFVSPPVVIGTIISQDLGRLDVLTRGPAVLLYIGLFLLSQFGLYWTTKRVQVIAA